MQEQMPGFAKPETIALKGDFCLPIYFSEHY